MPQRRIAKRPRYHVYTVQLQLGTLHELTDGRIAVLARMLQRQLVERGYELHVPNGEPPLIVTDHASQVLEDA